MSDSPDDPGLQVSRGRPPGLAVGLMAGGLIGVALVARSAPFVAVVAVLAVTAVALLVPLAIARRATVITGDRISTWGIRGPSSARSVVLSQLTEVRYLPGGRGPARLRLADDAGGRISIPLPSTGPDRAELLRTVAGAASGRGLQLDRRTRSRLGMELL